MIVTVTFALPWEFAAWRRLRSFRQCVDRPVVTYETGVGRAHVRVALTGIGPRSASAAAATIFEHRPDVCVVAGTSGGLDPALRIADVIAARTVRGVDGLGLDSDPRLLALAIDVGATSIGTLYSSPTILLRAEDKQRMSAEADAVDMESATILGECARRGIPGIAIRAISDSAHDEIPLDLNAALTDRGDVSVVRVLAALARRPHAVPGLVRLGREGRRAATALASFLDRYVEQLSGAGTMPID